MADLKSAGKARSPETQERVKANPDSKSVRQAGRLETQTEIVTS